MHDVELLSRSLVETIEPKLAEYGLDWKNVIVLGFGKGMILFNPITLFPSFMAEKIQQKGGKPTSTFKLFMIFGGKNRCTPSNYRQSLTQAIRKAPEAQCTPDTIADSDHVFDEKEYKSLLTL